eukprot:CAMPEP_0176370990 /NCGR_PEP_ID=MMETSP0126-20121128/24385_1 /TAXON_ID=141414 ORGANISM="Strombidinopsis acuminatum, Strain SPMC142" /NCGR_SAMPLE_ID=MMETSP0126 /ASSEMBLY_ACC=CAM_ASM_000229 /LENGTH=68 /DNA_ID=CAMNT_0017730269 /DNA_START=257 /DNA_END=463 /DNA_ORIENTATION=+
MIENEIAEMLKFILVSESQVTSEFVTGFLNQYSSKNYKNKIRYQDLVLFFKHLVKYACDDSVETTFEL